MWQSIFFSIFLVVYVPLSSANSLRRITIHATLDQQPLTCDPNGPVKCSSLGRPGTNLPNVERDDESVPAIPEEAGIYDFVDHGITVYKSTIGFPPGCARSFPSGKQAESMGTGSMQGSTQGTGNQDIRPPPESKVTDGTTAGITTPAPGSAPGSAPASAPASAPFAGQTSPAGAGKPQGVGPSSPKCPIFQSLVPNLNDWVNGNAGSWAVTNEGLIPRLTYSGAQNQNINVLLASKNFLCEDAHLKTSIRLDDASEAGIAFRIAPSSTNEYLLVLISSGDKSGSKISLLKITNGTAITQILTKQLGIPGGGILSTLDVIDNGAGNLIEVKLDGRTIFNKRLTATDVPKPSDKYRAGVFIRSGSADFSGIDFTSN